MFVQDPKESKPSGWSPFRKIFVETMVREYDKGDVGTEIMEPLVSENSKFALEVCHFYQ